MELVVDLHTHSHFSRATSKNCTIEGLYKWGKMKGIQIIGTGDFTHPAWFAELREKLEPSDDGLLKVKDEIASDMDKNLPASVRDNPIRFIPTVEIATIYSKGGKVRKLHQLLVAPSFAIVSKMNAQLERIGNLKADGRPILGLDSKVLLEMSLTTDKGMLYIPAHIWTPWFGMFGSKSGFDSVKEAYEDLTSEIRAIETGLSSDPPMNWRLSQLGSVTVTSHSDAHSPQKLGREATVVNTEFSYDAIINAIKSNDDHMVGTIEFFPQEGKYHYDGHRLCGIRMSPTESKQRQGMCPVCGKPLTIGVDYRVDELADKDHQPNGPKRVEYIIPLIEIIAELQGRGVASKCVKDQYEVVIKTLGDEFSVLRNLPINDMRQHGFSDVAYAINRMRAGDVHIEPGYDGVYGVIKLFADSAERKQMTGQLSLLQ